MDFTRKYLCILCLHDLVGPVGMDQDRINTGVGWSRGARYTLSYNKEKIALEGTIRPGPLATGSLLLISGTGGCLKKKEVL
jgi:hypothetical protein